MRAPYQCVGVIGKYLIAASAHRLNTFSLLDGSQISSWACPTPLNDAKPISLLKSKNNEDGETQIPSIPAAEAAPVDSDPPAKRRKLSDSSNKDAPTSSKNGNGGKPRPNQQKSADDSSIIPNIIAMTSSNDATYVIIVTGEDKTIRVLRHVNGHLKQISQRPMPKRPCAITLAMSDSTIICADKFGDVYSLPLLPDSPQEQDAVKCSSDEAMPPSENPKQFISSASDLTVHSARNRRALQNQLKQNLVKAEKVEINSEQQLLLGHVSMLTDVVMVENGGRSYIITADRDEHIRVSRGIPQAHIIEGYCMGHTDFVSRLCVPESARHLLISGGGDDDLFVWDWLAGNLLQKTNLTGHVEAIMSRITLSEHSNMKVETDTGAGPQKVVVSGIKHLGQALGSNAGSVVVMCEGVPALLFFSLSETGLLSHYHTLELNGNPLAMVEDKSRDALIISVDSIHRPGSIDQLRTRESPTVEPLQVVQLTGDEWSISAFQFKELAVVDDICQTTVPAEDSWSKVLYTLGNLRKRAGEE